MKEIVFCTELDNIKSQYIWNMIAGCISAFESVFFSIVVTKINGLQDAGIVAIGFAIGNIMTTIGKYGVRSFQVTDTNRQYLFSEYYCARIYSIIVMLLVNCIYMLYCYYSKNYSFYKMIIVVLIEIKIMVEVVEDVFAGEYQLIGRLDVPSKVLIFRKMSFGCICFIVLYKTQNLIFALSVSLAISTIIEIYFLKVLKVKLDLSIKSENKCNVYEIIRKCTPLCLSNFFHYYIVNGPRYAIDTVLDDKVQACYTFIAYPIFVVDLLSNFIYQPSLVKLSIEWNTKKYQSVWKKMHSQLVIIISLTFLIFLSAYFVGIQTLSFLFSTDLSLYKLEMLILLIAGGILAIVSYLSTLIITIRKTEFMIYGYFMIFIVSLFIYKNAVLQKGILGGAVVFAILNLIFAVYEYVLIVIILRKYKKQKIERNI